MGAEALRKPSPLPFIGQFTVRIFSIGLREIARDVLYLVNSKCALTTANADEFLTLPIGRALHGRVD
jgi:hypothetical protein